MTKLIQDLWIIDESGIVLFHRVFDETVDVNLFGGMLSALNSFAEEITKSGLSNFEISNKRFSLLKDKNYLFIANASKNHNIKKVNHELESIRNKFFEDYQEEVLIHWNGDTTLFKSFKKKIEEDGGDTDLSKYRVNLGRSDDEIKDMRLRIEEELFDILAPVERENFELDAALGRINHAMEKISGSGIRL